MTIHDIMQVVNISIVHLMMGTFNDPFFNRASDIKFNGLGMWVNNHMGILSFQVNFKSELVLE